MISRVLTKRLRSQIKKAFASQKWEHLSIKENDSCQAGGIAQVQGPEFKPQDCQKRFLKNQLQWSKTHRLLLDP
jgi:hypothetical protein